MLENLSPAELAKKTNTPIMEYSAFAEELENLNSAVDSISAEIEKSIKAIDVINIVLQSGYCKIGGEIKKIDRQLKAKFEYSADQLIAKVQVLKKQLTTVEQGITACKRSESFTDAILLEHDSETMN